MPAIQSVGGIVGGILLLIFVTFGIASAQTVQTKESQAKMTPHAALGRLKEGNARFAAGKAKNHVNYRAEVAETGKGQILQIAQCRYHYQ